MRSLPRFAARAFAASLIAAIAVPSFAVVATTGSSTPLDTEYTLVGRFNSTSGSLYGSGVIVGPHQILTARHVASSSSFASATFNFDGGSYKVIDRTYAPTYTLQSGKTTNIDLAIVTVAETFPSWYHIGSQASVGQTVTMVGYGQTGSVATKASVPKTSGVTFSQASPKNTYYVLGTDGRRRKGDNTLDATGVSTNGYGPTLRSYLDAKGEAALGAHDSGGGWFSDGLLIGISAFTFNDTPLANPNSKITSYTKYTNYGFGLANGSGYSSSEDPDYKGTPYTIATGGSYFGSGAIDLTNSGVQTWFRGQGINPVPEPAPLLALGLGAVAVLRRRRR